MCLCNKCTRICSVCRNHSPVLSSLMTYHWVCNKMGTTCGAGTAYPSGAPELTLCFSGSRAARSLVFCIIFCRSLFVFLTLHFLSFFDIRLRITASVSSNFFLQYKTTNVSKTGSISVADTTFWVSDPIRCL